MMDFMDNLRRGVDRAGFEFDRVLRANRVRAQISAIRSKMDEELRLIGRRVMDLYDQGEGLPGSLVELCSRIKAYEAEIAEKELELEGINSEIPPDVEALPTAGQPLPKCPRCGHAVHQGANYCSNCGADLSALAGSVPSPNQDPATPAEPATLPTQPSTE